MSPENLLALPLPPPLDQNLLISDAVQTKLGELTAFVPAGPPYVCNDPNAAALLLVPGLGLDGLGFIRQLPLGALSALHLFQTPNAPVPREEGLGHFASYVEEYILARKLDQRPGGLILGGASMGGAISLTVALRGRVKLRGLVLMATFGSCKHISAIQRLMAPLAYVVPMGFFRKCYWLLRGGAAAVTPEEARWMANPRIKRTLSYYGRAVSALTRFEQLDAARKLSLPVLVIHGTEDDVFPPAAGEELAAAIPGARFVPIPSGRHSLYFTRAEAVNEAIAEFLASAFKSGPLPVH